MKKKYVFAEIEVSEQATDAAIRGALQQAFSSVSAQVEDLYVGDDRPPQPPPK